MPRSATSAPTLTATAAPIPLDPVCEDFLDDTDWRAQTLDTARSKLELWCRWLAAQRIDVLDADRRDLRRYLAERRDAGRAPATRHKDWQIITRLYRWAATASRDGGGGYLADDPMAGVKAPHVSTQPRTRAAKRDEVDAIVAHLESHARVVRNRRGPDHALARRDVAVVLLMFTAGLRSGEIAGIDLADLGTRPNGRRVIALHPNDTKSEEPRLVPVTAETERAIRRYLRVRGEHPGPLFESRTGDRFAARAVQAMVERAADAAGVAVTSHQLRRGFTAEYLRAGGDVLSLEVIGGWADHRMPRRYLADEERLAALDRFDQVTAAATARRPAAPLRAVR